jgi:4-amino-4-deoxy-L-arabinose transferase-like glycosyltransferase
MYFKKSNGIAYLMMRRLFTRMAPDCRTDVIAYAILGGICIARVIYVGSMDLVSDEAYYWDWARHPAFGYFDHPPMVAWLIFASIKIFGDTPLGVKSCALICSLLASACAYRMVKKYVHRRSSLILYILLSSSVVLYAIGSLLATPDIPMVACWSVGMLAAYKMIFERSPHAWIVLGLSMGFGMLSKYSFALFALSLFFFLACFKEHRRILVSGRFLAALIIAFVIFFPNILWNARHHWASVLFQLGHGLGAKNFPRLDFLGDYFGGQAGILSVFPFILIIIGAVHETRFHLKRAPRAFLLLFFAVPFILFACSSLQKRVEPNWPCGAYVSGLALIPLALEGVSSPFKKFLQWMIGISLAVSIPVALLIMAHIKAPFLPIPSTIDPTVQIRGWGQLGADLQALRKSIDPSGALPLCANSYQDAALFAFYLPDHPRTFSLNINSRPNQYSLSEKRAMLRGQKVLLISVTGDSCRLSESVSCGLDSVKCLGTVYRRPDVRTTIPYGIFLATVRAQP